MVGNKEKGEIRISEPLLKSEVSAKERAISELLDSAYVKKNIEFETYETDLKINDTIMVLGINYKIKNLNFDYGKRLTVTVTCERYDYAD